MTRLPLGWENAKIGSILEVARGGSPRPIKAFLTSDKNGLNWIKISDATASGSRIQKTKQKIRPEGLSKTRAVKPGDFLLSNSMSFGRPYICDIKGCIHDGWLVLGGVEKLFDQDFLYHCLRSDSVQRQFSQKAAGSTVQNLNSDLVRDVVVPIPPLPEQRRIVRKLDTLTARSTTARTHLTAIEKLVERYELSLLRAAFSGKLTTDFREANDLEPVSDLLQRTPQPKQGRGGRQPTTDVTEGYGGISVNVPDVALPEAWEWVSLLRIARQETGHTPSRSRDDWWGGDVCWMSIPDANIHHGKVIHDTIQKTNDEGLANSSARLLPAGTVVLSRTASVGYICILGREMATSQDFATWTCSEALEPEYLMYALLSEGEDIKKFGEGSTHTTIYFPEIRAFNIKLAPLEEQREIVRRIETAFAKIDRLAAEAAKALKLVGHLDQRILAKTFAGELVPQDPTDEPAETLLARIRTAREAAPKTKRKRKTSA